MNMIHALLNQSIPGIYHDSNPNGIQMSDKNKLSFFQQLLSTEQAAKDNLLSNEGSLMENRLSVEEELLVEEMLKNVELNHLDEVNVEDLFIALSDLPLDRLKELFSLLVGDSEPVDEVSEEEMIRNLVSLIHQLIDDQERVGISYLTQLENVLQHSQQTLHKEPITFLVHPSLEKSSNIVQPNIEAMGKEFDQILAQVELLLDKIADEQDLIRISPRILELLEKWTSLANKNTNETNQSIPLATTESKSETRVQTMWKELLSAFQKRNDLATNQHYHTNAKVTSKDISKWMQSILNAQSSVEGNVSPQSIHLSNQPLSKMEQYVIYLNQNGTSQSVDKQLIDQFQQVMSTSRFLSLNNGVNQLSIALRPDNLGEMMVRFTELNGEMTLKIIVSSQATRQMLESNIHQLKNMFSPHQVVIEEREVMIENVNSQHEEQSFDEEKDQSQESNQEEYRDSDQKFEAEFHDLLMNAKV